MMPKKTHRIRAVIVNTCRYTGTGNSLEKNTVENAVFRYLYSIQIMIIFGIYLHLYGGDPITRIPE